jgi:iron complex outermembrane recepter protein
MLREPATGTRHMGSSSSWDLQGRYTGFAGWQLAFGVRTLFDADPPFTVQGNTFQVGFNPLAASPLGRAWYLRAGYAFK